jgi:CO dehydrogenase maturation factor
VKIAVSGKGGAGKTTIAGTLARVLASRGHRVIAVDDDSNPNLALTVGISAEAAAVLPPLPREFLAERTDAQGNRWMELSVPAEDIVARYGVRGPDDLMLLVMGQPSHGGSG